MKNSLTLNELNSSQLHKDLFMVLLLEYHLGTCYNSACTHSYDTYENFMKKKFLLINPNDVTYLHFSLMIDLYKMYKQKCEYFSKKREIASALYGHEKGGKVFIFLNTLIK